MNAPELPNSEFPKTRRTLADIDLEQIKNSLEGLRYGVVQIIVQDSVIVQIDRTEKRRLRRPDRTGSS